MKVKCPACGARGTDDDPELHAPEGDKDMYGFEVYGHDGGRAVRKCLNCGGGVYVKLLPPRYVAIPPDRWASMQEYFDAQMAELEERRQAFRQQSQEEQGD